MNIQLRLNVGQVAIAIQLLSPDEKRIGSTGSHVVDKPSGRWRQRFLQYYASDRHLPEGGSIATPPEFRLNQRILQQRMPQLLHSEDGLDDLDRFGWLRASESAFDFWNDPQEDIYNDLIPNVVAARS